MKTALRETALRETALRETALRETQRVLLPSGQFLATALNVAENSPTFHLAEEAGFSDFLSAQTIRANLTSAGFSFDRLETFAEGIWPGNPYDALPLKGDRFAHCLAIASRST